MENALTCHIAIVDASGKLLWGKSRQNPILLFTRAEPQVGDIIGLSLWNGDADVEFDVLVLRRKIESGFAYGEYKDRISYRGELPNTVFTSESTYIDLYLTCSLVGKTSHNKLMKLIASITSKRR